MTGLGGGRIIKNGASVVPGLVAAHAVARRLEQLRRILDRVGTRLGMAANGARGETLVAMKEVLGTPHLSREEANEAYRSLADLLLTMDPRVELGIANSVWIRREFPVVPAFVERIELARARRSRDDHAAAREDRLDGALLERELGFAITKLQSGPLGGDQQIGARIADGEIDFMIFFSDPLESQSHDPDIKALLRMAIVWNIPIACNRASADFMISSPLMDGEYDRLVPDYEDYRTRKLGPNEGNGQDAGDFIKEIV